MHEEMQTSQEELKSTNEELQSTNEELQSTNEELTTSKEEMQSLNEELQTVNAELQSKVDELSAANNDMKNLLNSTDIATVFLDNELHVRRFTTQATRLFKLIPGDVGRPLSDIVTDLDYPQLIDDAVEVLRTLVFSDGKSPPTTGAGFRCSIMPYRTQDNVIDGVVITFNDIAGPSTWKRNCARPALAPRVRVNSQPVRRHCATPPRRGCASWATRWMPRPAAPTSRDWCTSYRCIRSSSKCRTRSYGRRGPTCKAPPIATATSSSTTWTACCWHRPTGEILAANPAAQRKFGYSEAEFRAMGRQGLVDATDQRLAGALAEREPTGRFVGELTYLARDGRQVPVEVASALFADGDGRLLNSMIVRDIRPASGRKTTWPACAPKCTRFWSGRWLAIRWRHWRTN